MMSAGVRVEAVTAVPKLGLGEGPHWIDTEQSLYFVDLLAGSLHRFQPDNQKHTSTKPEGERSLSLVVPVSGQQGHYIVGHGRDLTVLHWDGENSQCQVKRVVATVETEIQSRGGTRFNDGKCDPSGRLWAGTMSTNCDVGKEQPDHGSLYSLQGNSSVRQHVTNLGISNGLAWTANTFYFIDSMAKRVDAFDFDPKSGDILNRRCVFDFLANNVTGLPDGMTIDSTGNLWVACFGSSQVLCVDPSSGRLVRQVPIPAAQVTSVSWGGRGLDELYVTTAAIGDQKDAPQSGRLFRVTGLGARGVPATEAVLADI